jgi:DNA-binding winged helix-turn-helix (wHTH) protein
MVCEFGEYELDEALFELRLRGRRVAAQPKVLELILYLAKNHDRVVSAREIFRDLWPDQQVGETSLTKAVRGARLALGDSGACQAMVRTVRGRGYRLAVPVRWRAPSAAMTRGVSDQAPSHKEAALASGGASGRDVRRDLGALSIACRAALTVAAVIGHEFSLALLSEAAGTPRYGLTELLAEAHRLGFLHCSAPAAGWYMFPRVPVRDALCESLSEIELARLRRQVTLAIESQSSQLRGVKVSQRSAKGQSGQPGTW